MKNQYFGDVNDYQKYGLLRILAKSRDVRISFGWMLTPDDHRNDGSHIKYLQEPDKWHRYDPELYDTLRKAVIDNNIRNINVVETQGLVPGAVYFPKLLGDTLPDRKQYFSELLDISTHSQVIFLDPDNGLEVKSVKKGQKRSSKYLHWDEVALLFNAGYSLLIYQHFPRVSRDIFVRDTASRMFSVTKTLELYTFVTSYVAFFLFYTIDITVY
jgi:hypothetical protein